MDKLQRSFLDVADALGLGSPAIVEKDYYVVELLRLLSALKFEYHDQVFAGGTALSKSGIQLNRMSEDVDIKLVPKAENNLSRSAFKSERKGILAQVKETLQLSKLFHLEIEPVINDEYRYIELLIRYPQHFKQAPCLRPLLKLELIETTTVTPAKIMTISSIVKEVAKTADQDVEFLTTDFHETIVEKLIALLRRTASHARNPQREDDTALVRHVHDYFKVVSNKPMTESVLKELATKIIELDLLRYGRQHPEFAVSAKHELKFGLNLLKTNPVFEQRFNEFVLPMVYDQSPVTWSQAFDSVECAANMILGD